MTQRKHSKHFGLMLMFIVVVFVALLINSAITALAVFLLVKSGMLYVAGEAVPHSGSLIVFNALISVPIGALVSVAMVKFPLKPVRNLIDGMDALAAGDFKIRMNAGSIMRRYPAFRDVSDSFNKMAEELESTEMLRSDFINNFSHEFKTPIVSIAGFTKLLKRGNLTEEQRKEYLDIIEEESLRLSAMATNVLNMTKIENQTILTDTTTFNISEQIRSAILLLDEKWDRKHIELSADFSEYTITGNEEMLKQVWINLLDNAVKFTPDFGSVRVNLEAKDGWLTVCVANTGSTIPPEKLTKIWNKFYQADESHASAGNGIGLAIVKKVTELHGGTVGVTSENELTTFTVVLPMDK